MQRSALAGALKLVQRRIGTGQRLAGAAAFHVLAVTQQHKGCGYVQFALREDAASAVQQLQHSVLGGRKLKVPALAMDADASAGGS